MISPDAIHPSQQLKTKYLGSKNPRLHIDEIQACAGGIRLDSMFVDEGFGSLDEESLEQALKALNSLADGRRLVGIISHVSELKERIDNKIIVTKQCGGEGVGSSIRIQ